MGFFQKIKQAVGIGGVKINLAIPSQLKKGESQVSGKVVATTKSDMHLLELEVELHRSVTKGRGDDKETKTYEMGSVKLPINADIKVGEEKVIEFTLPYTYEETNSESLSKESGALGALGKMGKFATNEKSSFEITATLDVKGVALDPNDIKEVHFVD